jgi:hypothetical protein
MAEKDLTQKNLEKYKDVFADIMNVLLFNGKRRIQTRALEDQDSNITYSDSEDGKIRGLQRDVVKRWKKKRVHIACLGIENQSASDPDMPIRMLGYDGAEYESQLHKKGEEKEVYPVVTIVLYFNYEKDWTGPLTLKERLEPDDDLDPFVNDYKINLFQIADLTMEQVKLFRSDFRHVAEFFVQKKKDIDWKPNAKALVHAEETLQLLTAMTNDPQFINAYNPKDPDGVPRTMRDVLARIKKNVRNEGFNEGFNKGSQNNEAKNLGTMSQCLISTLEQRFSGISDSLKDSIRKITDIKRLSYLLVSAGTIPSLDDFARQLVG